MTSPFPNQQPWNPYVQNYAPPVYNPPSNSQPIFNPYPRQPQTYQPTIQNNTQLQYNQQAIPTENFTGFSGRYIDAPEEIRLDEVPMTGSPCLFLTKDMTTIFLKVWNQDGKLITAKYTMDPDQSAAQMQPQTDNMKDVYDRLTRLEEAMKSRKNQRKEAPSGNA